MDELGDFDLTAKEYLSQIKKIDLSIRHLKMEHAELMEALSGVGGVDYSRDRVQTSAQGDAPYVRSIEHILEVVPLGDVGQPRFL